MINALERYELTPAKVFRDCAAVCGAIIVAAWFSLATLEAFRNDEWIPNIYSYPQAIVLAAVFAGYFVGWRHPLVGAALAIVGTAAFFVVGYLCVEMVPPLPAVWLAIPGVLYLFAWAVGRRKD
jgi:hypothetical protein